MITLHPVTDSDLDFLWQMLYYASHTHHEDGVTIADMKQNPDLIRHLDDWGSRSLDLALVAWSGARPVGACWLRHMIDDERKDVTFVDDDTPELVISIEPDMTGKGVGSLLLAEILPRATAAGVAQIVLTARASNPAVALYERNGFKLVERITNRVGTQSVKMIRRAPAPTT